MTPPGAELYRAAIDALEHPVAVVDSQGTVVAANRHWAAGRASDPIAGASVGESVVARLEQAGHASPDVLDPLRQLLRGDGARLAHSYRALDGRPFRLTATPIAGGGAVLQRSEDEPGPRDAWHDDVRRQSFLAEASALLISSFDSDTILRNLARMAVPEIADFCLVDLVLDGRSVRRVAIAHVDPGKVDLLWDMESRAPAEAPPPEVIRTGEPVLAAEATDDALARVARGAEEADVFRQWGLRSLLCVPIVARGRVLGAMTLGATHSGRRYTGADLSFAVTLAERVGLAVDNARAYRDAQEANRMKDEFLATLSHELRTPLNAIVGWAHVLRGGPLDKAVVARAVDTIDRNARAQTQLISDILDVSRIVTGKLRLSVGPVELPLVVEAAVEAARPAAAAKDIRLDAQVEPVAPVSGDADRLQQVVGNLLSNAVKYTPKGGRVSVRLSRLETVAEIVVEDTGVGIAPEFLPRLFERFRQPESSTTRPHGGIGLGLAIVRHIVELHGGRVEAASGGRGQGASFRVSLPLLGTRGSAVGVGPAATDLRALRGRAGVLPSLDGIRVLVVDDEKDARDVIVAILEQRGARTIEAGSVEEALARLEEKPDVLVSDIGLPDEDGYSLMRRIRALPRERGGAIPAAALTAYARTEDRMQALLAGFQIHVPKPVQPAELIAVVASLAARKAPPA